MDWGLVGVCHGGGGTELWGSSANERSRSTGFRLGPGSICASRWNEGGDLQGLKGGGGGEAAAAQFLCAAERGEAAARVAAGCGGEG